MKLKPRLNLIASLVDKEAIVLDVGCDHGYLLIYLVLNNIIKKGVALDINQGPLNNVKSNLDKYQIDDIECLLSNGLQAISDQVYDTIVIAGMGGSLIRDILNNDKDKINNKTLILQPNINSYGLRKFLVANNFAIIDEHLVLENNIIYDVIKAKQGQISDYSEFEYLYGKNNLKNGDYLLIEKMVNDLNKNNDIIKKLKKDNPKYHELKMLNQEIENYLNSKGDYHEY